MTIYAVLKFLVPKLYFSVFRILMKNDHRIRSAYVLSSRTPLPSQNQLQIFVGKGHGGIFTRNSIARIKSSYVLSFPQSTSVSKLLEIFVGKGYRDIFHRKSIDEIRYAYVLSCRTRLTSRNQLGIFAGKGHGGSVQIFYFMNREVGT